MKINNFINEMLTLVLKCYHCNCRFRHHPLFCFVYIP
uniref:Uncharacterized protein n=1 Tax=Arundo donax TaxID=35708 RepID=A0A0A9ALE7_ARUDO